MGITDLRGFHGFHGFSSVLICVTLLNPYIRNQFGELALKKQIDRQFLQSFYQWVFQRHVRLWFQF